MNTTSSNNGSNSKVLEVRNARVVFPGTGRKPDVLAVDDVSLEIHRGQSLGIVGASGCGKSTLLRGVMHLIPLQSGSVHVLGQEPARMSREARRRMRRSFQMVFQDPGGSLDARMRVVDLVAEPLQVHRMARGDALRTRATACLESVGIAKDMVDRYPHQFSGGQRQRIAIARAIVTEPDLLVCDEPTSALDVSVQAHVLGLLREIREQRPIGMLFVTHDMGVVRQICDDVIVMDAGRIVEQGRVEDVLRAPNHPVTQRLLEVALAHHAESCTG